MQMLMIKRLVLMGLMALLPWGIVACRKPQERAIPAVLTVGMELAFPPFETVDVQGAPTGFSVGLAQAIAQRLGSQLQVQNLPFDSLLSALNTKQIDMILSSMTITEKRLQVVDFSEPYAKLPLSVLYSQGSLAQNYYDLDAPGKQVGVRLGTIFADIAATIFPLADLVFYDNVESAILDTRRGIIDAFVYDVLTVEETARRFPQTLRTQLELIPGSDSFLGIAVKKGETVLLEAVNQALKQLKAEGVMDTLSDSYLADHKRAFVEAGVPFILDV